MCRNVHGAVKGASALTDGVLAAMSEEERSFWVEFNELAQAEIEANEATGNAEPYAPSEKFQELFEKALVDYSGFNYCQIHQLADKFQFATS